MAVEPVQSTLKSIVTITITKVWWNTFLPLNHFLDTGSMKAKCISLGRTFYCLEVIDKMAYPYPI